MPAASVEARRNSSEGQKGNGWRGQGEKGLEAGAKRRNKRGVKGTGEGSADDERGARGEKKQRKGRR
eukprot:7558809-Pyramimonas_sp.AAC.1